MKLFIMKDWQLSVSEEVWGIAAFKKLLDRDKTKEKEVAHAELLFIWYWSDVKSDYLLLGEEDRLTELKKDLAGLPDKWKIDKDIEFAIETYIKLSRTVIQGLYSNAVQSAKDAGEYLKNTKALLNERDVRGMPVTKFADITRGLKDIKTIMRDLKAAEKEVIKETQDNENKQKGARTFAFFEDGL